MFYYSPIMLELSFGKPVPFYMDKRHESWQPFTDEVKAANPDIKFYLDDRKREDIITSALNWKARAEEYFL